MCMCNSEPGEGEEGEKQDVKEEAAPPDPVVEEKLSPEALALKKELEKIFVVAPELKE